MISFDKNDDVKKAFHQVNGDMQPIVDKLDRTVVRSCNSLLNINVRYLVNVDRLCRVTHIEIAMCFHLFLTFCSSSFSFSIG
jgi:hypothetical protein